MIVEIIQCEMCKKQHNARYMLPDEWITIKQQGDREEQHFCSDVCLIAHFGSGAPGQKAQDAPQSKMRRFLLVDGETAEITEGIVWSDGRVSLNSTAHCLERFHCQGYFYTWEEFEAGHPGDSIQWIDQEVTNAH